MQILVVNGSPKGNNSITLQTIHYIRNHFPEHQFSILNAGQQIRSLEKNFSDAHSLLLAADIVLFSYPVYTFLVPSQLHRFVELMKADHIDLSGKFVSQISTSKHFYDVTAHAFLNENCLDLGMKVVRGLSADMEDLLSEKGQKQALDFFSHLLYCVDHDLHLPIPVPAPNPKHERISVPSANAHAVSDDARIVIVADLSPEDQQLADMIESFRRQVSAETQLVNLQDFPFQGGCLGCFHCAASGKCIYKDQFDVFLREKIQTADGIVIAFSIRDHSMGYRFKLYDDRQFCNGHRTVTQGVPFGYLISGDLDREHNLQTVIHARAEVGGNYLAGIVTDELDPDSEIRTMSENLLYAIHHHYVQPADFYGVGGMKIFRDLIWQMQGFMKADHKFYKQHGIYDFPQKHRMKMLSMYLVGLLVSNPKLMAKAGNRMTEGMLAPYQKVLEKDRKG